MRKPYLPKRLDGKPRRIPPPKLDGSGCWVWQGSIVSGYGKLSNGPGGPKWAHRLYYELEHGRIPSGRDVHHTCDNRACVNPAHLTVMTRRAHARIRPGAKLSIRQIREIRRKAAAGASNPELAAQYGVHRVTIGHIKSGRTWQDDVTCPGCGHKFDPQAVSFPTK